MSFFIDRKECIGILRKFVEINGSCGLIKNLSIMDIFLLFEIKKPGKKEAQRNGIVESFKGST